MYTDLINSIHFNENLLLADWMWQGGGMRGRRDFVLCNLTLCNFCLEQNCHINWAVPLIIYTCVFKIIENWQKRCIGKFLLSEF